MIRTIFGGRLQVNLRATVFFCLWCIVTVSRQNGRRAKPENG